MGLKHQLFSKCPNEFIYIAWLLPITNKPRDKITCLLGFDHFGLKPACSTPDAKNRAEIADRDTRDIILTSVRTRITDKPAGMRN